MLKYCNKIKKLNFKVSKKLKKNRFSYLNKNN